MELTSPPPGDGEDDRASDSTGDLRPSEMEQIAAERLDDAEEGHEEEPAKVPPPSPDVVVDVAAPETAATEEFEVPSSADAGAATPPAVAVDTEAQSQKDASQPTTTDAQVLPDGGHSPVEAAEHTPTAAAYANPPPSEGPERPVTAGAPAFVLGEAPIVERAEPAPEDASGAPEPLPTPPAAPANAGSAQPLASALDAAVRLAADANAAAEALEGLKRLLQRQLPDVAAGSATPPPTANAGLWAAPPAEPTNPPPLPLPALPLPGDQASSHLPDAKPQLPALVPARRVPVERRRLDVRGFFAGFALSGAFGVILYLFMTAG